MSKDKNNDKNEREPDPMFDGIVNAAQEWYAKEQAERQKPQGR